MEEPEKCLVFFVNGRKIIVKNPDPDDTLLLYLRRKLHRTGTKEACGEGACGACTVMVSSFDHRRNAVTHRSQAACLTPLVSLHGREVTTVEGIGNTETGLHNVQEQLAVSNGTQCGFCSPGMVMTMYSLLQNDPQPSVQDMEMALNGNICRCTGYRPILEGFKTLCKVPDIEDAGKQECVKYGREQDQKRSEDISLRNRLENLPGATSGVNVTFEGRHSTWHQPSSLEQLVKLRQELPDARIVAGASTLRFIPKEKRNVCIDVSRVAELREIALRKDVLEVGAGVTITELREYITQHLADDDQRGPSHDLLQILLEILQHFDAPSVANVGTVGGNVAGASPTSDLNVFLLATGSDVTSRGNGAIRTRVMDGSFFPGYRKIDIKPGDFISDVKVPLNNDNLIGTSFREEANGVLVNAVFFVTFEDGGTVVKRARLAYGGISATPILASKAQEYMVGKAWSEELCTNVCISLQDELALPEGSPGGSEDYRNALISGFFFRFFNFVAERLSNMGIAAMVFDSSALEPSGSKTRQSVQVFEDPSPEHPDDTVGAPIPHLAAKNHVTGQAVYVDDVPPFQNELHMAFVLSSRSSAKLESVDTTEALTMPGVVDIMTGDDPDIPLRDPPIFANGEVMFDGQCIAAVLAESKAQARAAARTVRVQYGVLPHMLTIKEAIQAKSFHGNPAVFPPDCADDPLAGADHVVEGEFETGSQRQIYMETQSCIVVPVGENGEVDVHISSQNPSLIQETAAKLLDVDKNKVAVKIRRLGGAFGGKGRGSLLVAMPTILAAKRTKRPVRCIFDRLEDMMIAGGRHPILYRYKIGCDLQGKIIGIDFQFYVNSGCSVQYFPLAAIQSNLMCLVNSYGIPKGRLTTTVCKTNTRPNMAARSVLNVCAQMAMEHCIHHVADSLGLQPEQVKEVNLFRQGDLVFNGQIINEPTVRECFQRIKEISNFKEQKEQVIEFNRKNKWRKRGIAIVPTAFGVSSTTRLATSLVIVYKDGSVLVSCSGVEMGQGLFTKMTQVATRALGGAPISKIHIKLMNSDVTPEGGLTAGSTGSDHNGMAVKDACEKLKSKLEPFKQMQPEGRWEDWVQAAYANCVELSVTGAYWVPTEYKKTSVPGGRSASYLTYGAGCSMVEVDCLTGRTEVLRTDLLMDVGKSLNPTIDIGQIEGAFLMGQGLYMSEEDRYSTNGKLLTTGLGSYRVPRLKDIPQTLNVYLLKGHGNPRAIYSSKGIGEPAFFLGSSVFFATKMAVASARHDAGKDGYFQLNCPATPERVRLACCNQTTRFP